MFGPQACGEIVDLKESLQANGVSHEVFSGTEVCDRDGERERDGRGEGEGGGRGREGGGREREREGEREREREKVSW